MLSVKNACCPNKLNDHIIHLSTQFQIPDTRATLSPKLRICKNKNSTDLKGLKTTAAVAHSDRLQRFV